MKQCTHFDGMHFVAQRKMNCRRFHCMQMHSDEQMLPIEFTAKTYVGCSPKVQKNSQKWNDLMRIIVIVVVVIVVVVMQYNERSVRWKRFGSWMLKCDTAFKSTSSSQRWNGNYGSVTHFQSLKKTENCFLKTVYNTFLNELPAIFVFFFILFFSKW